MTATIITIGDELLIGQVIDTNSAWMAQLLNQTGISVLRRIAVGDNQQEIISELKECELISDLILITGGLGPTKDDITKETLNRFFGSRLVRNEEILLFVKSFFEKLNRPMPPANEAQADLPDNCIPIKNHFGTAPGMWFNKNGKIFVAMPGVPFEMKPMMTDWVIPQIKKHFDLPTIIHRTIHTQGLGESFLSEKIKDIEETLPSIIKLAYLPHYSIVRLRLSGISSNEKELSEIIAHTEKQIHERIGEYIFGYDDTSIEKEIGNSLRLKNKTMSTAESCTGGLVAHKICLVPGASDYFAGSVVSYSYELKETILGVEKKILETFGAVSEETVRAMITGVLRQTGSDYAIAISGIAGPGGGTPEKPVGTVWIAVGNNEQTISKRFQFARTREIIMEYTAITSLAMFWRFINGKLSS